MKKLIASLALAILLIAVVLVGIASADRPEPKAALQAVVAVGPIDGAVSVDVGTNVTATFDVTMTNVSSATFTLAGPDGAVTGTVTYSNATQTATLDPDADLDYETVYTATLSKDLAASTGITLGTDYVWSFTSRLPPMPVLAIAKTVVPTDDVKLGSVVTYTVSIANNGDVDATGVVITDNLPALVEFGGYVDDSNGTAQLPVADVITWTYDVAASASYSFAFTATVTAGTAFYGTDVTNTAYFTSTNAGSGYDDAVFTIEAELSYIYMPVVMRNSTGTLVIP